MKIRTRIRSGYVFFGYESYDGTKRYRNYNDARKNADEEESVYLVGWLHSSYAGCTEEIDEITLTSAPTVSQVKEFMKHCFDCLEN